jgi:hypothetical protein
MWQGAYQPKGPPHVHMDLRRRKKCSEELLPPVVPGLSGGQNIFHLVFSFTTWMLTVRWYSTPFIQPQFHIQATRPAFPKALIVNMTTARSVTSIQHYLVPRTQAAWKLEPWKCKDYISYSNLLTFFSFCCTWNVVPGFRRLEAVESGHNTSVRKSDVSQCSLYMKELQGFIARAVSNYLAPFQNQEIVMKW